MTQPAQLGILQNTKFIEPTTYERHTIRYIFSKMLGGFVSNRYREEVAG